MKESYPVVEGAEKFQFRGNDIGILISHGFVGTPQSVRYLGERLAHYGYSILAPRLQGHGTHYYDLEKCSQEDWFASLETGYKELKQQCTQIFVLGQSMGGTLALRLAHKYQDINGIMLINPALSVPSYDKFKEKTNPRFLEEGEPDIKAKEAYEITYNKVPITAIHELQKLMELTPPILSGIYCPILGIKSAEDHVVPPQNTDYILEHIGSERKGESVLQNSFHVASLDNDKEQIVRDCHLFVQRQLGQGVA